MEVAYWLTLVLGLGLLLVALLFGDIFDALPGSHVEAVPVLLTALAAFGAGGLFGTRVLDLEDSAIYFAGASATGIAALAAVLFATLGRHEAVDSFDRVKLIGQRGRVTLATGPHRVGRVTVNFIGATRSFPAISGEEIPSGERVVVRDVIGRHVTVARDEGPGGPPEPPPPPDLPG